jgi:uncharacterized protein YyaL (SSP411 family)
MTTLCTGYPFLSRKDYANLAEGLLALYQATFEPRWCQDAHQLVDSAMARFWVPSNAVGIAGFNDATHALLGAATSGFRPQQVIAYSTPDQEAPAVPLLEDRDLTDGQPAAYVCCDFARQAPVTKPEALLAQLKQR